MKTQTTSYQWKALGSLLCFTFLFCLYACNTQDQLTLLKNPNQPDLTQEEIKRLILLDTNYLYSIDAATKDAIQVASELDAEDVKGGKDTKRTIKEVFSYSIPDTIKYPKSSNRKNDPGVYVFNFNDKQGFAIISSDERAQGRLAFAGKGTIDKDINPGVRLFLSRTVEYIQFKRQEVEVMRGDAAHISLLTKLTTFKPRSSEEKTASNERTNSVPPPCPPQTFNINNGAPCGTTCNLHTTTVTNSSSMVQTTLVAPLLHTRWDQGPPYNNNFSGDCSQKTLQCGGGLSYTNSNYYAGCVPISEAQVVALYYARYNYQNDPDWSVISNSISICSLNATQIDKMASLIKNIYNKYSLATKSCADGTFVFDQSILGLTHDKGIGPDFGFVQGDWTDYTKGNLVNSLQNNSPVPIHGSQHEICLFFNTGCSPDPKVMHQWVIDGLLTTNQVSNYTVYPVDYIDCVSLPSYKYTSSTLINTYVHNNWGWGGDDDGWYIEGTFGDWDITHSTNVYSFNHFDKIIAYVTHN